jgi:hypothetical protein
MEETTNQPPLVSDQPVATETKRPRFGPTILQRMEEKRRQLKANQQPSDTQDNTLEEDEKLLDQ